MIIKILPDNTVTGKVNNEPFTINSTHSHKAPNDFIKSIADALPYKGAMVFDSKAPGMTFNSGQITVNGEEIDINDFSHLTGGTLAFVTVLANNPNVIKLINAKNKLKELQDGTSND
jgi:hypothetical protein